MKGHLLKRNVKANGKGKASRRTQVIIGQRAHQWKTKTDSGELTFWGVYELVLLSIQNQRGWVANTCRQYDKCVCDTLAPFFRDDTAFASLTTEDVMQNWENLCATIKDMSRISKCSVLLRLIMGEAFLQGYTSTLLWDIYPTDGFDPNLIPADMQKLSSEEFSKWVGEQLAHRTLRNRFCIPLDKEYALYRLLERLAEKNGDYLFGLILLETFCRPSEGTAISFGCLKQIGDCRALLIVSSSDRNLRSISLGGKTSNMFRLVPITDHFANLIQTVRCRIEQKLVAESQGKESLDCIRKRVDNYPIACHGTNYEMPCKLREANSALLFAMRDCGIEESIISNAYLSLRESEELSDSCERLATAYIFRHQGATNLEFCGCTQSEIYTLMGHKIETPNVKKSDYSNSDKLRVLASKVKRRPLFQLLDGVKETAETIEAKSLSQNYSFDTSVEILVKKGTSISISATAREPYTEISVDIPDSSGLRVTSSFVQPRETSEGLFMGEFFRQRAQVVNDSQRNTGNIPVGEISMAMEDKDWLDAYAGMDVAVLQEPALFGSMCKKDILTLPPKAILPALASAPAYVALPSAPKPIALLSAPAGSFEPSERRVAKLQTDQKFFVTENLGIMPFQPDCLALGNYARAGSSTIKLGKKDRIANVFSHDGCSDALLLDPCGRVYCIPANTEFEEAHLDTLKRGGILLQMDKAALVDSHSQLLIISESGKLRHISIDEVLTIRQSGRQLVALSSGGIDYLSAACFCPRGKDVILVSSDGMVLCLTQNDLSFQKAIKAMNLNPGARIVSCFPYADNISVLCVSAGGKVFATQLNLTAHHKGSKGVILMELEGNDTVAGAVIHPDAFLLLRSDGSVLCLCSDELGLTGRGSKGRQGMRLKSGQSVLGILPLALEQ